MEIQDRWLPQEPRFRPPKDSLIPPGHSTGTPSPIRSVQGREQGPRGPPETTPTRRARGQGGKLPPNHPILQTKSPKKKKETPVIDAVKLITGAQTETQGQGEVSVGDTPEYDWDTRYDGIQGFQII